MENTIQPGAVLGQQAGNTLAFIFKSITEENPSGEPILYAVTHAHGGVPDEGEPIYLLSGLKVGTVVAKSPYGEECCHDDWTLIRISEDSRQYVDFSMRYWSGPTGTPDPDDVHLDDVVCWFGWGNGYSLHEETQPRCGQLTAARYRGEIGIIQSFPMNAYAGDSGSPIIHHETGQAMGMLLGGNPYSSEIIAIDICTLIQRFADYGFELELATAPYDPPEAKPTAPAPWTHPVFQEDVNIFWDFETECIAG